MIDIKSMPSGSEKFLPEAELSQQTLDALDNSANAGIIMITDSIQESMSGWANPRYPSPTTSKPYGKNTLVCFRKI